MTTPIEPNQPFWKDEPDNQNTLLKASKLIQNLVIAIGVLMVLGVFGITFGLVYQLSPLYGWGVVIYFIVVFGTAFISGKIQKNKRQHLQQESSLIQQKAQERAAATLIGSAIHVAGIPGLQRDQNVVLALTGPSLDIYSYDHDTPLVRIPLDQITAIHTVVYDDERVPHLDIIDTTAQALQLSIRDGEVTYDCLFRTMRKVRPVDWYHTIQMARARI